MTTAGEERSSTQPLPYLRRVDSVRLSSIGAGSRVPYIRHIVPEMRQRATTLLVGWGHFPSLTSMFVWYGVCSTGDVRLRHAKILSSKGGTSMKPAKHIQSSFFPANWWNEREMEQWRARPAMARAARAKRRCIGTTPKEEAGNSLDRREQPVRIVAVSAEPLCGGEEFARSLAARLGWQCVDSAVLIGRAVARGGNRMQLDRKSTRLNSSHYSRSRMPSSA